MAPPDPLADVPLRRVARRAAWDVIVVGSGVGGCVTGALVARAGRRALVIEKNETPGGILAAYRRGDYKFDAGSHLVAQGARGPIGAVLREAGVDPPRLLTHPTPVRSRGVLDLAAPPSRRGLPAVAIRAADALDIPLADRARIARLLFQVFTLTPWELDAWDRRTLDEFIRAHTEHPAAYFLFSFLASIFYVLPPWEVAAGESIRGLRDVLRAYSLSYVEGGMDAIAASLLRRVVAADGDVVTGRRVVAIHRGARGLRVTCDDGAAYEAPQLACNLAPADLVPLLDDGALPADWIARARAVRPSGNAHQLKLALRRKLVEEGCVIGGLSVEGLRPADLSIDLLRRTVASIAEGRVTDPLALYAPVPTNFDPRLAPDGHQILVASIYGPTRPDPADPPARWQERIMASLARAIPGLEDAIVLAEFSPVPAIGQWMGKSSNAAICNGQVPGQVGRDRLPVQTPIEGLFLVGDGAGGRGIGIELAARSAMEAVARMRAAWGPA